MFHPACCNSLVIQHSSGIIIATIISSKKYNMNLPAIKLLVSSMLLVFLSACAPYYQAYYPDGGTYSGYGVTQRSYYGGYPYRYDNHSYRYNGNYRYKYDYDHHQHDGYNSYPSWNKGYVRPNPPNTYNQYYPGHQKHKQSGYQDSVPAYTAPKDHHDQHGNNNRSKPPSDRPWQHDHNQHNQRNSDAHNYGQNHRADDRRNQITNHRDQDHGNDKRERHENHQQAKDQRENRRGNHYQ